MKTHFLSPETGEALCNRAKEGAPISRTKKKVECGLCLRSMRAAGLIEGTNTRKPNGTAAKKAAEKKSGKAKAKSEGGKQNGASKRTMAFGTGAFAAAAMGGDQAAAIVRTLVGLAGSNPIELRLTVELDGKPVPVSVTVQAG